MTKRLAFTAIALAAILMLGSGCTFAGRKQARTTKAVAVNTEAIAEERRAMTTATVDTLNSAPTNAPVNLAKRFAKRAQQLDGLPKVPVDVQPILEGDKIAIAALTERLKDQDKLMAEKTALDAKLRETEARLIEMGQKYEEERNTSIAKRVRRSLIATLGIGGTIALLCFCPALIPVFGQILAWIVSLFPKLAGLVGVVSTKAFDSVVTGIEKAKEKIDDDTHKDALQTELSKALDRSHKTLVKARRERVVT